jgi:Holliday junction resolvase RusA-like endonuclease
MIVLRVYGTPASQGSKRAFVQGGRAVMLNTDKKLRPWRNSIIEAARSARVTGERLNGPLELTATFVFNRPRSHYRTGKNAHLLRDDAPEYVSRTPDIDKTLRSTLDGITDAGIWKDDAQVVKVTAAKRYASEGEAPGAHITIGPIEPPNLP